MMAAKIMVAIVFVVRWIYMLYGVQQIIVS